MKRSSYPEAFLREVREIFRTYIQRKNLRQTPERFAVLEEVYAIDGHFDADELFLRLRQKGSTVSRATVYNTLELLRECNLVTRHQFGRNQAKYERSYGYRQHDHLICLDCGQVLEFCDPRLQDIQQLVEEVYHFEVTHHSLELYGHCRRENCPNRPSAQPPTG
ncbi:MAG: transcriptional repressor [Bacteroidetes bacterium]|nr:transcriptional repressor [Rhodothermia bacterium]MCS7154272.1 transcriptional repressor [Bacteroidota bacterium]MCX7906692.1 transcriptional repressor [Bacteroidota bacterium]MDW8137028.1 transcriptional repressor [Bacteroidota bacterium]MDW8285101.1 transcriptional repressor [Bacteroidota bacterium]